MVKDDYKLVETPNLMYICSVYETIIDKWVIILR